MIGRAVLKPLANTPDFAEQKHFQLGVSGIKLEKLIRQLEGVHNMQQAGFDTMSYKQTLENSGLQERQAHALADALKQALGEYREGVCTREEFRVELSRLQIRFKNELGEAREKFINDMANVRIDFKTEITATEIRLTRWIVVVGLVQVTVLVASIFALVSNLGH